MSPEQREAVNRIITLLKAEGATDVLLIDAASIVVDERVRLKCQVPHCDSYGMNLMCPPYLPSIDEFRKCLSKYEYALLLQVSAHVNVSSARREVFIPAKQLHELVNRAEREAFIAGFRFAAGFIGGCCRLCEECVVVRGEKKCRHPFKARPSMEAMGIDVIVTAEQAGLPLSFPVSDHVTWIGLVLL